MRIRWIYLPALAGLTAIAACTSSGTTNDVSPSGPAGGEGPSGPPPGCTTGTWQSASTMATATRNNFTGTVSGGEGVRLSIEPSGASTADFSSMRPIDFAVAVGSDTVKGQYHYAGTSSATMGFARRSSASPGTTSTPHAARSPGVHAASGTWQPIGNSNEDNLRVTLQLTQPVNRTPLNNVSVGSVTGPQNGQVGNVVDLRPVLRKGAYTCHDDTLTIRPEVKPVAVAWMFRRV